MNRDPHLFLEALAPSTMKFGLERMRAVDAALGQPWRGYRTLHVAGTNGKGSTCAFAESILREAGLRVGLYTSPHLERVNERIRVDGQDIRDSELAQGIDAICAAFPPAADRAHEDALTYFEFLTALALWFFREKQVDVGIIEVGLGGKLDGTNIITADVCAIATISFDHQEILGDTLTKIASDKAGILKPDVPAAVLTREPEALAAIDRVAREVGAPLKHFGIDFDLDGDAIRIGDERIGPVVLALEGLHQRGNAALAAQAAKLVSPRVDAAAILRGLASARWPGRLERIGEVLLDGAHNPEGAAALGEHLATLGRPVHLVFGVLGDKDLAPMLAALIPRASRVYLVAPASPRALQPSVYLDRVRAISPAEGFDSLDRALSAARETAARDGGQVVVAGSLYLVGPARRLLSNVLSTTL